MKEQADHMRRLAFVALLAIVAAIVLAGCGGPKVEGVPGTVATVNGTGISAEDYLGEMHRKMGQQALKTLIERQILLDWAKKDKVAPTDAQVDKYISVLKREMQYDQFVKTLGETGLRQELERRQALVNLSKKMSPVTDKEVKAQYDRMKMTYVHGPRKFVAVIIGMDKKSIEAAAKKVKGGADFDETAQEYSVSRAPIKTWIDVERKELPAELVAVVKDTKVGAVSKVFALGQTGMPTNYGVLKVMKSEGKGDKSLDDVKGEVEDEVALQKTQPGMDPTFSKAAEAFDKKFTDMKKNAKIQIDIPQYRGVIQDFKPAPMPMMYGGPQARPGPPPGPPPARP